MTRARDLADSADKDIAGTVTLDVLGIGTLSPAADLHVNSGASNLAGLFESTDAGATITLIDNGTTGGSAAEHGLNTVGDQLEIRAVDNLSFETAASEAMRIDSSGNAHIGGTTSVTTAVTSDNVAPKLIVEGTTATSIAVLRQDTSIVSGNSLGSLGFYGTDTTSNTPTPLAAVQALASGTHAAGDNPTDLRFLTTPDGSSTMAEAMRIDSSGNVGIGTSSPAQKLTVASEGRLRLYRSDNTRYGDIYNDNNFLNIKTSNDPIKLDGQGYIRFDTNGSEAMRIDSSGNLLVGKTAADVSAEGLEVRSTGKLNIRADGPALDVRMSTTSTSDYIAVFRDNNTGVIKIGESGNAGFIEGITGDTGLKFEGAHIRPRDNQADADNVVDLGSNSFRFDDIYATNGTINTSDRNEKQQIAVLTDTEITAANAISKLFKNFKWNDKVAEKGDAARTHTGIIAQEVEQAMTDAGLSANNYAFFISETWWETQTEVPAIEAVAEVTETTTDEDGNEVVTVVTEAVEARDAYTRTDTYETAEEAPEGATERNRKGIRYTELLSFIGAATEQRLASIELRLAALETE